MKLSFKGYTIVIPFLSEGPSLKWLTRISHSKRSLFSMPYMRFSNVDRSVQYVLVRCLLLILPIDNFWVAGSITFQYFVLVIEVITLKWNVTWVLNSAYFTRTSFMWAKSTTLSLYGICISISVKLSIATGGFFTTEQ